MNLRLRAFFFGPTICILVLCAAPLVKGGSADSIKLEVDATDAPRKILHARLEVPAKPGPVTLYYPKWIPGDHAPDGPLVDLAGLRFSASGKSLRWRRDLVNMYAFHLDLPQDANQVEIQLDFLISPPPPGASSWGAATSELTVVCWEQLLLYPQGRSAAELTYEPRLRLPSGWKFGTALPVKTQDLSTITFSPVSLSELVDSPVLAGAHFRIVELTPGGTPLHEIDIASDSEDALSMSPDLVGHYQQLVRETSALFGARHYRAYHFLLTLSDDVAHFGLEHHESSDDRVSEQTLQDSNLFLTQANLLPHEFTHSWNGKFRRPAGLLSPDFQQPMTGELLWVYEGLTQYLGDVLTARSSLWTPQQFREELAYIAATLDHRAGRTWRPLQDTADSVQVLSLTANDQIISSSAAEWTTWRRSTDYYDEGTLIWLDVDTTLRRITQNRRSIDDFCKRFLGAPGSGPDLKTYTFDDVVTILNDLAPNDWRGFFRDRLDSTNPTAPLAGIQSGGWRVTYNDSPNVVMAASETVNKKADFTFSVGMVMDDDGFIRDVVPDMPAARAGLGPDMKVLGINGKLWALETMRKAVAESQLRSKPLELLVTSGKSYQIYRLEYRGGLRYPHLERDSSQPDLLQEIIRTHAKFGAVGALLPGHNATPERSEQN